jgi:hypothetical protein
MLYPSELQPPHQQTTTNLLQCALCLVIRSFNEFLELHEYKRERLYLREHTENWDESFLNSRLAVQVRPVPP